MTKKNYKVGYCKPPIETRFQKGVCPNPAGRGRKLKSSELHQIEHILYGPVRLQSQGREMFTLAEIVVKKLIRSALQGNAQDALHLLRIYKHKSASANEEFVVHVEGGLPGMFD